MQAAAAAAEAQLEQWFCCLYRQFKKADQKFWRQSYNYWKKAAVWYTVDSNNSDSKVVLSVYNGKKGIKFVWGGTASELRSQLEAVLTEKILPIKGISYRLLEMTIHFYEIVPILKVFGRQWRIR